MATREENQFGKYQLLERIATGGMAEIYRARFEGAAGVTKPVVIKKILPHYAGNRSFISMFINEAKIAVGLSHGNIAQVFDFGEIDGEYFLAMEYVHGQPLSKVLKRARSLGIPVLPTPFAVLVALEVSKGLHYAHTRLDEHGNPLNIIHRDVSSQNVLVSYEGQVKLVDFGIAKARHAHREQTEAGAVKGKYVYFAPEQARAKELDARTDVYAAGIVLYEMLCGRMPFEGRMMEVLGKIVRGEFPKPRAVNPDITPALERILLTSMAHEKADRYQTAEAFQEALATYLYTHAPTFSSSSLACLMMYLFEEELVAEGRPVQLPRDFLQQVPLWRKKLPSSAEVAAARKMTALERPSKSRLGPEEDTKTDEASDPRRMRPLFRGLRRRALFVAAPLLAMLAGAMVVIAVGFGSFSIQLTSNPPGATVRVDGQPAPTPTPVLISNLSARVSHLVEVTAQGRKPWSGEVSPDRGGLVALHVELEPEPPPRPVAPPAPPKVEKPPPPPPSSFQVLTTRHALLVPPSRAARMRLEPRKRYRIWTEGEVFYFLEGSAVPAKDSFGQLGPKARQVKGASALYAFLLDDSPAGNSGAVKLRIQERGASRSSILLVDAREHAIALGREQFTVTPLEAGSTYELSAKHAVEPARTRSGKNGRVERVVCGGRVVELGKPLRVGGLDALACAFPDDAVEDNGGAVELTLSPVAAGAAAGP